MHSLLARHRVVLVRELMYPTEVTISDNAQNLSVYPTILLYMESEIRIAQAN